MVDELWNGLQDNGFHVTDSRQWSQHPDRELTPEDRLLIVIQKQIPPQHSKNVRLIKKGGSVAFLYALSSENKHFWGISQSVISQLSAQQHSIFELKTAVPWAVVLLDGDWRMGYWFDSATVLKLSLQWRRREGQEAKDTVYLVGGSTPMCRRDTVDAKRFLSSNTSFKFLTELLDQYSSDSSAVPVQG
jgi:hypothetical protein